MIEERILKEIKLIGCKPGVYVIKNKAEDKYYIGESRDVGNRLRIHFNALEDGTHPSKAMQSSFQFWGPEVFFVRFLQGASTKRTRRNIEGRYTQWLSSLKGSEALYSRQALSNKFTPIIVQTKDVKKTLSERLRDQIEDYGPAKVAAKTGINKSVLSRFLKGGTIALETAEKIMESLEGN